MAKGNSSAAAKTAKQKAAVPTAKSGEAKRSYLSQSDVPSVSLSQALRVPRAIAEYGFQPTTPLNVASALGVLPNTGTFRGLCGASIAYGLTKGGAFADEISLEPLGLRIVRPTKEGDETQAQREALMRPRVVGEFLRKYNGAALPREDIGKNVLIDMGVPPARAAAVLELIVEGAESVGLILVINEKKHVDLSRVPSAPPSRPSEDAEEGIENDEEEEANLGANAGPASAAVALASQRPTAARLATSTADQIARRVFIAHGKNRDFLETIKKLLGFGELTPLVSVERPSVSQPVPDKVFNEMRACGAAIIHVDAEQHFRDADGNEHAVLNPNVLIEIGAAIALYGKRFILLVRDGVKLPSDLQGLFEVRYKGEFLDGDATIRLLEAIQDIKNHQIPERYPIIPGVPIPAAG